MAERDTEILEEGDIFFFYRPRVEEEDPSGREDVQRFGLVLRPHGGKLVRLLVIGGKRLPELGAHERLWGFVDAVADSAAAIETELRGGTYQTKTRGERHAQAARPAGEGVYVVSLEDGQMHLSYELELPERPGEVQRAFNIAPKASFVLSIKNPEKGQPTGAGLRPEQKADYADELQKEFRGRRFAREDVRLLDAEGAEFILIGARQDPEKAYGLDIEVSQEDYETSEAVRRLGMVKSRHPVAPLFEGKWE